MWTSPSMMIRDVALVAVVVPVGISPTVAGAGIISDPYAAANVGPLHMRHVIRCTAMSPVITTITVIPEPTDVEIFVGIGAR